MLHHFVLAFLLLCPVRLIAQVLPSAADSALATQHFVCNVGYSPEQCRVQVAALRRVVSRYATTRLGTWTWVLVRSQDWKRLKDSLELDRNSPAFSFLERRETFVEEALVSPVPGRSVELMQQWGMSRDDLLLLAVTHELGHGLCGEKDEHRADAFGRLLRAGENPDCHR